MGAGSSSQAAAPPPPKVIEDPYPSVKGADGISLSQAVICNDCELEVDTRISSANVKLVRELGDITSAQCQSYVTDKARVANKYMSLSDFLLNLQAGKYARPVSEEPAQGGQPARGYCEGVSITDEDAAGITAIDQVDGKVKGGRIRKVSGSGGFSSGTKARFIPNIPFKMSFKGQKAAPDVNGKIEFQPFKDEFSVSQLALYYPSPIRIDSVQADALLALNDPSDAGAKFIVLIPLRATNAGAPSAEFINRIAKYVPSVQQYEPSSGTYPSTDIQTGADWSLGKLFTLDKSEGEGGKAVINNGFFTWTGVAGFERYKVDLWSELREAATKFGNDSTQATEIRGKIDAAGGINALMYSNVIRYGWRPIGGLNAPQYFMLDTPLDINSSDLAMITRNLDATPSTEANHPIPAQTELVYHTPAKPGAPSDITGKGACGIGNLCEGFETGVSSDVLKGSYSESLTDPFEKSCPGAKCDPFLQNAKKSTIDKSIFTPRSVISFLFNLLTGLAMLVGAYVAMSMVGNDYDLGLRSFAEQIGQVLGVWVKNMSGRAAPPI